MAWKWCFVLDFSPHKAILWGKNYITVKNKNIFMQHWIKKNIIFVSVIFNRGGQMLSYEVFSRVKAFPVQYKEYCSG